MEYQPLDTITEQIRLLRIIPSHDQLAPIECTLENVSLLELPSYTALSYCWGNPREIDRIIINGTQFDATRNLYRALVTLRAIGVGRLWIDAISINQADLEEKGRQISLMSSIYRRAQDILAWTGPKDEKSDTVIEVIDRYRQSTHYDGRMSGTDLEAVRNFLRREYWTRVWIIQELVLPHSVVLHIGEHAIPWDHFETAFAWISMAAKLQPADKPLFHSVNNLIQLRRELSGTNKYGGIPLIRALRHTWMAKATETRDKIFGLLALVADSSHYIAAPTYQIPINDLCQSMEILSIRVKRSLDEVALLGAGCDDTADEVPSWCPQFHSLNGDTRGRQLLLLGAGGDASSEYSRMFQGGRFHASGQSFLAPTQRHGVLTCRGINVGGIANIGRSIRDERTNQEDMVPDEAPEELLSPYATKTQVFYHIYHTFLYGASATDQYCYSWSSGYATEILRAWRSDYQAGFDSKTQAWIDEHKDFRIQGRTIREWCKWKTWTVHGMQMRNACAGRRQRDLFEHVKAYIVPDLQEVIGAGMRLTVTTQGYLGWAPRNARRGDLFYILEGCNVPVLLRPREEGGFLVVGDAYISGMMHGEAVKGNPSWEEVNLH